MHSLARRLATQALAVVASVSSSGCVVKWDDGSPNQEVPFRKICMR